MTGSISEPASQVASACDYYGWACGMGSLVETVLALLGLVFIVHWFIHQGYTHP